MPDTDLGYRGCKRKWRPTLSSLAHYLLGQRGWKAGELLSKMESANILINLGLNGNKYLKELGSGGYEKLRPQKKEPHLQNNHFLGNWSKPAGKQPNGCLWSGGSAVPSGLNNDEANLNEVNLGFETDCGLSFKNSITSSVPQSPILQNLAPQFLSALCSFCVRNFIFLY